MSSNTSKKILIISRLVAKKLNKELTLDDYHTIIKIINSIPNLHNLQISDVYQIVFSKLIDNKKPKTNIPQYMLDSIYENEPTSTEIVDTNDVLTTPNTIVNNIVNNAVNYIFGQLDYALIPKNNYKHAYIVLDTNNVADTLSNGIDTFGWYFLNNATVKTGIINYIGTVRDIVGLRVYGAKLNIDGSPTTVFSPSGTNPTLVGSPASPYYYNNNSVVTSNALTILINEFSAQASIGREGRKYHFILLPFTIALISAPAVYYVEYINITKGDGWVWFKTPITTLSTLTISMGNPFNLIPISKNIRTLITMEIIYLNNNDDN